jgi:hypothetical protein
MPCWHRPTCQIFLQPSPSSSTVLDSPTMIGFSVRPPESPATLVPTMPDCGPRPSRPCAAHPRRSCTIDSNRNKSHLVDVLGGALAVLLSLWLSSGSSAMGASTPPARSCTPLLPDRSLRSSPAWRPLRCLPRRCPPGRRPRLAPDRCAAALPAAGLAPVPTRTLPFRPQTSLPDASKPRKLTSESVQGRRKPFSKRPLYNPINIHIFLVSPHFCK